MKTPEIKHLPFIAMRKKDLDGWKEAKRHEGSIISFSPVETVYVSIYNLKEIASQISDGVKYISGRVWAGMPAMMSQSWVNNYSKTTPYNYCFSTGHYHSLWELLYVEDVIDWSHCRIKDTKVVRDAADMVWHMAGKVEEDTPIYF